VHRATHIRSLAEALRGREREKASIERVISERQPNEEQFEGQKRQAFVGQRAFESLASAERASVNDHVQHEEGAERDCSGERKQQSREPGLFARPESQGSPAARKGGRARRQAARALVAGVTYGAACAALLAGCAGSGSAQGAPEAALATSRAAQDEFRSLRKRFVGATPAARGRLAGSLESFLERHGDDPRARVARLYLAWAYIQRGELARARSLTDATEEGALGSARDFATITEAAIAERQGDAARALALLEPLAGKVVDSDQRAMFDELYVAAAVSAKKWPHALQGMVDWLSEAAADEQEAVRGAVQDALARLPASVLEKALAAPAEPPASEATTGRVAAREWLRRAARERLARLALEARDSALARRVLQASASVRPGESEAALSRLASENAIVARIAGRVVGLALSLGQSEAHRRSAQVATGMTRALGLAGSGGDDAIRLVVRDDGGDADGLERTLAELAGDGAVILVAAVDDRDADRAVRYADRSALPVIVLATPRSPPPAGSYAFLLGIDSEPVRSALRGALATRGIATPAEIGPSGTSCTTQPSAAGEPRFPVQQWKKERLDALLLLGDASCSRDALRELDAVRVKPTLGLGFESAELFETLAPARSVLAATAGSFPYREQAAPSDMRRWVEASGAPPRWYEALGHDAARLASAALEGFPVARAEDTQAVARLHRQARARLSSARAELWTSDRRGFEGRQALARRIDILPKNGEPAR